MEERDAAAECVLSMDMRVVCEVPHVLDQSNRTTVSVGFLEGENPCPSRWAWTKSQERGGDVDSGEVGDTDVAGEAGEACNADRLSTAISGD